MPSGFGIRRADFEARHTQGGLHLMALQAVIAAHENRFRGLIHAEGVEDDAFFWIERGEFQDLAALDGPDRNVVIEENGTRRAGRNERGLKAGFGEDQHLGIGVDGEIFQEAGQIAEATRHVVEFRFASLYSLCEAGYDVIERGLEVLDGGMFGGDSEINIEPGECRTGQG